MICDPFRTEMESLTLCTFGGEAFPFLGFSNVHKNDATEIRPLFERSYRAPITITALPTPARRVYMPHKRKP